MAIFKVKIVCLISIILIASGVNIEATAATFTQEEAKILLDKQFLTNSESKENIDALLKKIKTIEITNDLWPITTYLLAEAYYFQKDKDRAKPLYKQLIDDAYKDKNEDTMGGNSLVAFSLYRLLQIEEQASNITKVEFSQISKWADDLLPRQLVKSAFEIKPLLPSVTLLKGQLYDKLSSIALRISPEKVAEFYFEYLNHSRNIGEDYKSDPRYQLIIDNKTSTADRISLIRGKGIVNLI